MAKSELIYIEVQGLDVPVKRYYEKRRSVRVSIGKNSVLLRLPKTISDADNKKYHIWARDWIAKQITKSPDSINHLFPIAYESGTEIQCMERIYHLHITTADRVTNRVSAKGNTLYIVLNADLMGLQRSDTIKVLISRVMGKLYKNEVTTRVRLINQKYFNHEIKSVRLKYNRTNWGSCSSDRNINLSTRLLVTPEWVRDYVIVHELAHLNEMNHSAKYWAIVNKVYPDYKRAEKWLKVHGGKSDFLPIAT